MSAGAELLARALGYVVALALVLAVIVAACGALARYGAIGAGHDPIPTLAPLETPSRPTAPPRAPRGTDPPAVDEPAPAVDCGDADPDDPEIDPEYDCEPLE